MQRIPATGYIILLGALIVAPALVAGVVTLLVLPDAPPIEDWRDAAGYALNSGLSLVIWFVAARAFRRVRSGDEQSANKLALAIAKIQPLLWLAGVILGVVLAVAMSRDYNESHANLVAMYCDDVVPAEHPRRARCLEVAEACDDQTEAGPCGRIETTAQGQQCMNAYKEAVARLEDDEKALMPEVSSDYDDGMRAICILERTR